MIFNTIGGWINRLKARSMVLATSGVASGKYLRAADNNGTLEYTDAPEGTVPSGTTAGQILTWNGSAWVVNGTPSIDFGTRV